MHESILVAVRRGVSDIYQYLEMHQPAQPTTEPYLKWVRNPQGGWGGMYVSRISPSSIIDVPGVPWGTASASMQTALEEHAPQLLDLIGSSISAQLRRDGMNWLRTIIYRIWNKHQTINPTPEQIDEVLGEFIACGDADTVTYDLLIPLINFTTEPDLTELPLPGAIVLRPLSEAEVSEIYGGSVFTSSYQANTSHVIHEYCLTLSLTEPKHYGGRDNPIGTTAIDTIQNKLDQIILALRTFKEGAIGYNMWRVTVQGIAAVGTSTRTFGHEYIPFGRYLLLEEEIPAFSKFASYFEQSLHPSLAIACSRLADASVRTKAQDKLLDAAIGLEALLLSNVSDKKYQGELKYRLSTNYGSLFGTTADRIAAAKKARDIYDARSIVAHGGATADGTLKLGKRRVHLEAIAADACGILRELVHRYLSSGQNPEYLTENYWENMIFNNELDVPR